MADRVKAARVPLAGNIVSVMLQMISFGVLSICLARRIPKWSNLKSLSLALWIILIIYIDSSLFVFATAVITEGIGINESQGVCSGGILLCLVCYLTTKILIYYFLVEKAYIIRGSRFPRMKTKLWLFNCFGMLLPYMVVVVLNFIYRIAYIDANGVCIIGMEKISMLPLIIFDVVVNVYLTLLFIVPLRKLYSYQHNTNNALRTMAYRSFIGSCATLTSSVVNLTILMTLKGEPGWICLMCCNADVLFSILVLHWVTQIERTPGSSAGQSQHTPADANLSVVGTKPKEPSTPRSGRNSLNLWTGGKSLMEQNKNLAGTMTTEVKGGVAARRKQSDEEIVELRGIRVLTERTQEVEMETDARSEGSACGGYISERKVVAEKMV